MRASLYPGRTRSEDGSASSRGSSECHIHYRRAVMKGEQACVCLYVCVGSVYGGVGSSLLHRTPPPSLYSYAEVPASSVTDRSLRKVSNPSPRHRSRRSCVFPLTPPFQEVVLPSCICPTQGERTRLARLHSAERLSCLQDSILEELHANVLCGPDFL